MALTNAQLQTLKADILADPAFAGLPMTSGAAYEIAVAYSVVGSVDVWRTDAPVSAIYDALDWTKFTPADAVPAANAVSGNAELHQFNARILLIQTKQMNLQNMLQGRTTLDASKANVRAGLRDAAIQLPSGAGGASTTAGGANGATILAAMIRKANRAEALFATGPVSTGATSAKLLAFEGNLTSDDVQQARELA